MTPPGPVPTMISDERAEFILARLRPYVAPGTQIRIGITTYLGNPLKPCAEVTVLEPGKEPFAVQCPIEVRGAMDQLLSYYYKHPLDWSREDD